MIMIPEYYQHEGKRIDNGEIMTGYIAISNGNYYILEVSELGGITSIGRVEPWTVCLANKITLECKKMRDCTLSLRMWLHVRQFRTMRRRKYMRMHDWIWKWLLYMYKARRMQWISIWRFWHHVLWEKMLGWNHLTNNEQNGGVEAWKLLRTVKMENSWFETVCLYIMWLYFPTRKRRMSNGEMITL